MTNVTTLASRRAAADAHATPAKAEPLPLIQLHAQAHNALSTALHCLQRPDCTPEHLRTATARAIRAATLLKRATVAAQLVEA